MNATIHKICWAGLMMLLTVGIANAAEAIGTIKTLKGEVNVVRGSATMPAAAGMRLMAADKVVTGVNSAVGVVCRMLLCSRSGRRAPRN